MSGRRSWRPVVTALIVGVSAGVLGLRWGDALLVGLVTAVLVAVGLVSGSRDPDALAEGPPGGDRSGTRREVAALTWSFIGRDGRVSEAAVRRLRSDATRRLAQRGLVVPGGITSSTATSPDVPDEVRERARAALGDRAWKILTARGGWMPSLADIGHCVDVVERLGTDTTPSPMRGLT